MDSGQLRRMTSLNSTNAGHTSENGRTNGGCGWLSVEGHGRSWRTPKGDRSAKTCARLWGRIQRSLGSGTTAKPKASAISGNPPKRQLLPVFAGDSSHQQVGKSSGELAHVERFFGRLRQKLARYVRRTRAASQSERMLHLTTKLFVEWYNEAIT